MNRKSERIGILVLLSVIACGLTLTNFLYTTTQCYQAGPSLRCQHQMDLICRGLCGVEGDECNGQAVYMGNTCDNGVCYEQYSIYCEGTGTWTEFVCYNRAWCPVK